MNPFQYQKNINIKFFIFNIKLNIDISLLPVKSVPNTEFFWYVFSRIRTGYKNLRSESPYSVRMEEKTDQKNSVFGHFLHSIALSHLCESFYLAWYMRPIPQENLGLVQKKMLNDKKFWKEYAFLQWKMINNIIHYRNKQCRIILEKK